MRIRMEVDVTRPLMRKKSLKLANGQSKSVYFKYERLNLCFFIWGMLDHTESYSDLAFEVDGADIKRK